MTRERRWRGRLLLAGIAVLHPVAGSRADERCGSHPPPVFHCEDWRRDEDGLLIARRTMVVGLMQVTQGHYIGGGIRIAGHDYGDLLRRQCAPARPFWKRWLGIGE